MKTYETPPNKCQSCGETCDCASHKDTKEPPQKGDFSVCFYCGEIHVFDENLKLRKATQDEINKDKIVAAQLAVASHNIKKKNEQEDTSQSFSE